MWPLALCSLFSNLSSRAAFRDLMASIMWTLVSRLLCSDFFSKFASRDTILIRIEFCTVEKVVYEWYTAPTTTAIAMVTLLDSEINRAFGIQLLSNFLGIPNLWSSVHWLITTASWVSMFKTGSYRKLKKKGTHDRKIDSSLKETLRGDYRSSDASFTKSQLTLKQWSRRARNYFHFSSCVH